MIQVFTSNYTIPDSHLRTHCAEKHNRRDYLYVIFSTCFVLFKVRRTSVLGMRRKKLRWDTCSDTHFPFVWDVILEELVLLMVLKLKTTCMLVFS